MKTWIIGMLFVDYDNDIVRARAMANVSQSILQPV